MTTETGESRPRPRWKSWLIEKLDLSSHNREELLNDLQRVTEKNVLPDETVDMLQGVLELGALQVHDVMVPKSQVQFVYETDPFNKILDLFYQTEHSRYPVVAENGERVLGILLAKDLLKFNGREQAFELNACVRPALLIPESQRLNTLLLDFRTSRNHMAIVIDEYSSIAGIVTFEDLLEQIVGEIADESDELPTESNEFVQQTDGSFVVDASTPVSVFNRSFDVALDTDTADTLAGIVIHAAGKILQVGESVEVAGFTFTVLQGDNRRIQQLAVIPFSLISA